MKKKQFKDLFEGELYRLRLTKENVLNELEVTRPTLLSRIKKPETFKAWEILALTKMGFNLDYFKNINKFKH